MNALNETPFVAGHYVVQDKHGTDLILAVLKATYSIGNDGMLSIAQHQQPHEFADQYFDKPENSGIRYAADLAYGKCGTDIAVIGHAYAMGKSSTESYVYLKVGMLEKRIKVFGERRWHGSFLLAWKSSPQPFEKIPIVYENAFGGEDKSHKDFKKHEVEERNLVGTGFFAKNSIRSVKDTRLPNFEDPEDLIRTPFSRPKPAGFGFISPNWQPRRSYAGTHDKDWEKNRMPLLPEDFDTRFFNAAHPDLIYSGFLRGDEPVLLAGVTPMGRNLSFALPGVAPQCAMEMEDDQVHAIEMNVDKIVFYPDEMEMIIVWTGHAKAPGNLGDIRRISYGIHNLISAEPT
jgi:hypothetical protein